MEIDRRELLTGLAATAAAAMLPAFAEASAGGPALPEDAAFFSVRRLEFPNDLISSTPRLRGLRSAVLGTCWHFDPHDGRWLIRHVPTGLTCWPAPREHDDWTRHAVFIANPREAWPDAEALELIGRAARFAAVHASIVHATSTHAGAIYLRYTRRNPKDPFDLPDTEDAPALSPTSPPRQPRRGPMSRAEATMRTLGPLNWAAPCPSDA